MTKRRLKLLLFGIDSADWDIMQPLLEGGDLPTIFSLMEPGSTAHLESTVPSLTHVAWPTIMTGTNPGKHGLYGPMTTTWPFRPATNADRMVPALWEMLSEAGFATGVFNVPVTYPTNEIEAGYMVAGEMGSPRFERRLFYPRRLYSEARQVINTYPLEHPRRGLQEAVQEEQWRNLVEARHTLCLHLLERQQPDALLAVMNYVDHIQHHHIITRRCGDIADIVAWAYRQADEFLGQLLEYMADDGVVVVLSDHGAAEAKRYFCPNILLYQQGLLRYRSGFLRSVCGKHYSRVTSFVKSVIEHLPEGISRRVQHQAEETYHNRIIDYGRTKAYAQGQGIFLNTVGRSPSPSIAPSERVAIAEEISQSINDIRDPHTGGKPIKAFLPEELYEGPMVGQAPDVIVVPEDPAVDIKGVFPGAPEQEAMIGERDEAGWSPPEGLREGHHRSEGILVLAPGPRALPSQAHVADITPTVLSLLDLPVPDYVDGVPLCEGGTPSGRENAASAPGAESGASPESTPSPYTAGEAAEVAERLRDLGYL